MPKVDAAALGDTATRLATNSRWEYDDLSYWGGEVDGCTNAYTLVNGAWLGVDVNGLAQWLVDHQLDDGGWNCEWVHGSKRSSFHSTLNVPKGLLEHESRTGGDDRLRVARRAGQEYLLERRLLYRRSTVEWVGWWAPRFVYPFRWFYSVLKTVDHFRSAAIYDGVEPGPRPAEAVELIRAARETDGRWLPERRHPGRVWFEIDVPAGEPSKWPTLIAIRALAWWDDSTDLRTSAG